MEKLGEGGASSLIDSDKLGHTAHLAHVGIEALDVLSQKSPNEGTMWDAFITLEKALAETAGHDNKIPGEDEAYGVYKGLGERLGLTEGELKFDLDELGHIRKRGQKK